MDNVDSNIIKLQEAMKKREDYMSMRLPRSFALTVDLLLGDCKTTTDSDPEELNHEITEALSA